MAKRKTDRSLGIGVTWERHQRIPSPKVYMEACQAFTRVLRDHDISVPCESYRMAFYVGTPAAKAAADDFNSQWMQVRDLPAQPRKDTP